MNIIGLYEILPMQTDKELNGPSARKEPSADSVTQKDHCCLRRRLVISDDEGDEFSNLDAVACTSALELSSVAAVP